MARPGDAVLASDEFFPDVKEEGLVLCRYVLCCADSFDRLVFVQLEGREHP